MTYNALACSPPAPAPSKSRAKQPSRTKPAPLERSIPARSAAAAHSNLGTERPPPTARYAEPEVIPTGTARHDTNSRPAMDSTITTTPHTQPSQPSHMQRASEPAPPSERAASPSENATTKAATDRRRPPRPRPRYIQRTEETPHIVNSQADVARGGQSHSGGANAPSTGSTSQADHSMPGKSRIQLSHRPQLTYSWTNQERGQHSHKHQVREQHNMEHRERVRSERPVLQNMVQSTLIVQRRTSPLAASRRSRSNRRPHC